MGCCGLCPVLTAVRTLAQASAWSRISSRRVRERAANSLRVMMRQVNFASLGALVCGGG